jgi:hypothetical protein
MWVIIGSIKGEVFVIGHTSSRRRADRFVDDFPHGVNDEYEWVETQHSSPLRTAHS